MRRFSPTEVEPESTPTPPPFAVRIEAPPEPAPRRRSWVGTALLGAICALPIAAFLGRSVAPSPPSASLDEVVVPVAEPASPALPPAPSPAAAPAPTEPAAPRADAHLNRDGRHYPIRGGVLFTPKTFESADGTYDLYVHFHGNTKVVLESAEHAGVDAFVAVVNLGVGSAPYEHDYTQPGSYAALLADIQRGASERGLVNPHLRRVALGSWSAGYGAIGGILQQHGSHERLDALLVLDGIHVGWLEDDPKLPLNAKNLAPFLDAARAAARGDFLFSVTHSEVVPVDYASSTATADLLLDTVGASRHPADPDVVPEHVELEAAKNAVAKRLEKQMEPLTEASVGSLRVRGYRGNTPEHHMAHLLQMGATVMPELAARWERSR